MPTLILEGPDAAGKTTLARHLLKATGLPTILISRSGPPSDREHIFRLRDWILSQPPDLNLILDRYPLISEKIYSKIVRRKDWPGWNPELVASSLSPPHRCRIIYCRPPRQRMIEDLKVENQLEGVPENFDALVDEYDKVLELLGKHGVQVARYSWPDDSLPRVIGSVRSFFLGGN